MKYPSHNRLFLFVFLLCAFMASACSSTPDPATTESPKKLSGTDEQIFVGDSMEMNYDPNVIMKRAESYYEKESFLEAIVEYKHFLDLHRNHMLASYAQYKIALSHYKRFQTIDRDPLPVQESLDAFQALLTDFPNNRYETEAREKITACQENLAQHDLFVGQFYYKRQSYLAAAHRFQNIVEQFPHIEAAGEAMYHLAETYEKLGDEKWSRDWLVTLVQEEHQDHPFYQPGMQMLAKLQDDYPNLTVPAIKERPSEQIELAHIAPPISGQPSPSIVASLSTQTASSDTQCSLGSWCGSSPHSQPKRSAPTSSTNACKPGQWC